MFQCGSLYICDDIKVAILWRVTIILRVAMLETKPTSRPKHQYDQRVGSSQIPHTWLFIQQLVHTNSNKCIYAPYYWPFARRIHRWSVVFLTKVSLSTSNAKIFLSWRHHEVMHSLVTFPVLYRLWLLWGEVFTGPPVYIQIDRFWHIFSWQGADMAMAVVGD